MFNPSKRDPNASLAFSRTDSLFISDSEKGKNND